MIENKIFTVSNSYGSCSLKSDSLEFFAKDVEKCLLELNDKNKGYIRVTGSQHIYEHGYSAQESIFSFITEDYKVIGIHSGDKMKIIKGVPTIRIESSVKISNIYTKSVLEINGLDGSFKYDLKNENNS